MKKPRRKTVSVGKQLAQINFALSNHCVPVQGREALAAVAESMLMDSGNYLGFSYLYPYDDWKDLKGENRREYETRRKYLISSKIKDDYNDEVKERLYRH